MVNVTAFIGLVFAVLLWGISFISIDVALLHITVMELNIVRFMVAVVVLWIIQWIRPKAFWIEKKDMPKMILAGVSGTAGYYYFENLALTMISPGMTSIVTGAIPVTTIIIAILFFGKRTRFKNIFMVGLSFVGVLVLMNPFSLETSQAVIKGVWTVMLANVFWSFYSLMNEGYNKKYDKLQVLTFQYTAGFVALFSTYLYDLSVNPEKEILDLGRILGNDTLVGHLIFICVFVSIGAYFFYNFALDHLGVMITALFINVVPVITMIISVGLSIETWTFNKVTGCWLVVVDIFFIEDI